MMRTKMATALLLAACVPVWSGAGWLLGALGLEALDLVGRIGLVVVFLSAVESVSARVWPHAGTG